MSDHVLRGFGAGARTRAHEPSVARSPREWCATARALLDDVGGHLPETHGRRDSNSGPL